MNPKTRQPKMPMRPLRILLLADGMLLLALGTAFIFAPRQVEQAFHFEKLPAGVSYIIGLYGCVMATLSVGYFAAAADPIRHLIWVQVAIGRGLLEFILSLVYLGKGIVTFNQAAFGMAAALTITILYLALYPRKKRAIRVEPQPQRELNPTL